MKSQKSVKVLGIFLSLVFSSLSFASQNRMAQNQQNESILLTFKEVQVLPAKKRQAYLRTFNKLLVKYEKYTKRWQRKPKVSFVDLLLQEVFAKDVVSLSRGPCLNKGILFMATGGKNCTDNDVRKDGIYAQLNNLCQTGETHCSLFLGAGNCTSKNSTKTCLSQSTAAKRAIVDQGFEKCNVNDEGRVTNPSAVAFLDGSIRVNCGDFVSEYTQQRNMMEDYISKDRRSGTSKAWLEDIFRKGASPFKQAAARVIAAESGQNQCKFITSADLIVGSSQGSTQVGQPRVEGSAGSSCGELADLAEAHIKRRATYAENGEATLTSGPIVISPFKSGTQNQVLDDLLSKMRSCGASQQGCAELKQIAARQQALRTDYQNRVAEIEAEWLHSYGPNDRDYRIKDARYQVRKDSEMLDVINQASNFDNMLGLAVTCSSGVSVVSTTDITNKIYCQVAISGQCGSQNISQAQIFKCETSSAGVCPSPQACVASGTSLGVYNGGESDRAPTDLLQSLRQ